MLYFFLSYAHEDDPGFVRRFYEDLSNQVRLLAGVDGTDQVGFLDDRNIVSGQRWITAIDEALCCCQSFVALTSPRYFRREYCGKEWYVFGERLKIYERQWRRSAPAMLPMNWIPTTSTNPVAAEFEPFKAAAAFSSYRQYGLRQMLDLKRFRENYRMIVFRLAQHIVSTAQTHVVPRLLQPRPLAQAPNIFATHSPVAAAGAAPGEEQDAAPHRHVHFVVVAGSREEMVARRRALEYYGDDRVDWAPYRPSHDGPLGGFAAQIAGEARFGCEVVDVSQLARRIEQAHQHNEVVVLLVDAWSLELEEHHKALIDYDRLDEPHTAVIVPFNAADPETMATAEQLEARLARVLPSHLKRRDAIMRQNVRSHDQFGASLEQVLELAQNRILRAGTVNRRVPPTPNRRRPILDGPTSTTDGTRE